MADVLIKDRTVWELPCGAAGLGIATALVLAQFLAQAWPEGKKKKVELWTQTHTGRSPCEDECRDPEKHSF